MAYNVFAVWQTKPFITLMWKDVNVFQQDITVYSDLLVNKSNTVKNRPQLSFDLKTCNKALDVGIAKLKKYLDVDAASAAEAKANYAKFGIIHQGSNYILPTDKDKRAQAIALIPSALLEFGYGAKPFGTAYFTPLIAQYTSLVGSTTNVVQNTSSIVGNKNAQKEEIIAVLNSLINVIKGNYPKTYKTELRSWGFLKENY